MRVFTQIIFMIFNYLLTIYTKNVLYKHVFKWSIRDSNSSPLDCQSNALAR